MTNDQIREVIDTEVVVVVVWRSMSKMFGFIKTTVIKLFDERYTDLTKVVAAAGIGGGAF